ncbi:head maturation protease, ClpP-related [Chitinophaga tropicalis]|uniref:ATP-dependent Clp protease proteolytic subunit n=1 Tax=Chitinophaga tropicalis TaxID=2683588 RepID=A0A7K1UAI1_9BACT|nr:head maturation protease, ClpP-related [Chitinophaga tropicalis]MVT11379.1 hypothetical protein [Chitinophaga tropicalis]
MKRPAQIFNFRIQNASSDSVDIFIDGEIVDAGTQEFLREWWGDDTTVSFKSFREELGKHDVGTYNIYINSPGGQVTDAMAMHDHLQDLKAKGKRINTFGRGIVASAATYILMAGDAPEMSANSWFMIHNVSGIAWGDVNQLEQMAATMRKFNNAVRDFYAKATSMRKEEISKMMDAETWMLADEAKNKGFIKQISGEASFTNLLQEEYWNYSNKDVLAAYNSAVKTPASPSALTIDTVQQLINNSNNDMKKFFQNILDSLKNLKTEDSAKPADIVNQITEALTKPFEDLGAEIENNVNTAVNAAKTELQNALKRDYDEKITALENKVTELEKKNGELETELADNKGKQTNSGKQEDGPKPIGNFSNAK